MQVTYDVRVTRPRQVTTIAATAVLALAGPVLAGCGSDEDSDVGGTAEQSQEEMDEALEESEEAKERTEDELEGGY